MDFTASNLARTALVVIDVQRGFDDAAWWGERDNPDCEANIAALVATWRDHDRPVVFVRHDSTNPRSPLYPGQPGHGFKEALVGDPDLLVVKSVNSAFHGTPDLHAWLQAEALDGIVICGITTNHCCETTARVGGNLGYAVLFALDATHTFDRRDLEGVMVPASEIRRMTALNLQGEFATVVSTQDLVLA
ncbi:cysteine hydrolase family protein [Lacisediminihabitans sp.]|uniref:cysteine hydrolase family protein n=1 Tax=Lacisediminihabitans sp. TaxID=2787631 RepID=UPI00374CADED